MRTLRPIVAVAFVLLAAGCGGDSGTGPRTDYLGVYDLTSVEGQRLPAVLFDDGDSYLAVTAGDLVLSPSSRMTASITIEAATSALPPESETLVCTGTHSRNGNRITIQLVESANCAGGAMDATLDGRTLTVSDPSGATLVYTKEP